MRLQSYAEFKKETNTGNKLQILSKVIQDEKTSLNELREMSESMTLTENHKLICSSQTILCLKEKIKPVRKLKEGFKKQCIQQIN